MTDCFITLISYIQTGTDEFLQPIKSPVRIGVAATSIPVSRSEFYKAGTADILPAYEFRVNPIEYHGETEIEFENKRLTVYRTYEPDADTVELYCQLAAGLNEQPTPGGGNG